jgi:hypothetical protein
MKIATKVIFASALMLSGIAPTLSYAAYFVDQTKTWATDTRAQDAMGKKVRVNRAFDAMAYAPAYAPANYGNAYFRDFGIGSQH